MKILRSGSLLLIALGAVWSASIPFTFDCSKESAFVMDPNQHLRVGYVTDFNGLGVTFQKDLQFKLPFTPTYSQIVIIPGVNRGPISAKVVGVIEKFTWSGGVGDPLAMQFYVSQENATLLKTATSSPLKTNNVQSIGWLIGDYDQETKTWFEAAKPSSSPTLRGMIQGSPAQPAIDVDPTPVRVQDGIDVSVYKVTIKIVPVAHQVSTLFFANSSSKPVTKIWGLP